MQYLLLLLILSAELMGPAFDGGDKPSKANSTMTLVGPRNELQHAVRWVMKSG